MHPDQFSALTNSLKSLDVSDSLLRDWFAGQALSSIDLSMWAAKDAAKQSYAIADAMMEERGERIRDE